MKYKDGVYTCIHFIKGGYEEVLTLCNEMKAAMVIVDDISKQMFNREATITAMFDGKHMKGSKHYTGEAFDIRIRYYPKEQLGSLISTLKVELGTGYDIVHHKGSHIHIEFDPKN